MRKGKFMRYIIACAAFFLASGAAYATPALPIAPAPEMDLGIAGLVMVAGAAFLARRRRG
jgi:LPXTG-motif cell wall-anchored protein